MKKALLLVCLASGLSWGDQIVATEYFGLNNNSTPAVIDADESQDLLNVDVSMNGKSFKKRDGFGLYKDIGTDKPIHGGHHFFDATGNDCQVWGSSTSLYGIVAGATPTQLVSSATIHATWDCADTQGFSYCVNSARNAYIRTNAATITWYTSPLGTMVESTPDRVVVAGVSGTPNNIYVSQSNVFTNYTIGTGATDPFTEPIASPGSRLTHLRWGCGKLLWWKDASFGSLDFEDQTDVFVKTISDTIGTLDNTSAIDPGGNVWFRGQDGHAYKYDCSFLTKESIPITQSIQASSFRTSNSWTQSTQSEFAAGSITPTANLSTSLEPGAVVPSSFTATETLNADFSGGTVSSVTISGDSLYISTDAQSNVNPSFEAASSGWTGATASVFDNSSYVEASCTLAPRTGSRYATYAGIVFSAWTAKVAVLRCSDNVELAATTFAHANNSCTYTLRTISMSGLARQCAKINVTNSTSGSTLFTSSNFIANGSNITFYSASDKTNPAPIAVSYDMVFDDFANGVSSITIGSYTSRTYDATLSSNVANIQASVTAAVTNNTTNSPTYQLQTASDSATGPWTVIATSGTANPTGHRYYRYRVLFSTVTSTSESLASSFDSSAIVTKSTGGIYVSAVRNAPNFGSWDVFSATSLTDGGTLTYYVRAGTSVFIVSSATPTWVAATAGSLITASTGTYMQERTDFVTTASTRNFALNDFSLNWFEGTATDQAYAEYFDNAIWYSLAYGVGQSTNNYVFKCDLLRLAVDPTKSCWTIYNIATGGLMVQNDTLYFGSTTTDNIFNFGTATSDNGTAINAYRKSKEYTGSDPFMQNQLSQIDTFAKKDNGTTLTTTYTTEGLTSTSYNVSLTTGSVIAQSRKILPSGKLGYTFNIKYEDTSTSSDWEVFGYRILFLQLPYRPTL